MGRRGCVPGEDRPAGGVRGDRASGGAEWRSGPYEDPEADAHHAIFACRPEHDAAAPRPDAGVTACAYWPPDALPRPISDFTVRRTHDALDHAAPTMLVSVPSPAVARVGDAATS